MKLPWEKIDVTDAQERDAVDAVRTLVAENGNAEPAPSATYFANLTVKTNETIDHVTSGKALSISWLARVAVPGVVAILFFFIGLHYYKPEMSNGKNSIAEAVKVLPQSTVDSMMVSSIVEDGETVNLHSDIFDVSSEQLAEYFVSSENEATLLETIPERQLNDVASILETKVTNL